MVLFPQERFLFSALIFLAVEVGDESSMFKSITAAYGIDELVRLDLRSIKLLERACQVKGGHWLLKTHFKTLPNFMWKSIIIGGGGWECVGWRVGGEDCVGAIAIYIEAAISSYDLIDNLYKSRSHVYTSSVLNDPLTLPVLRAAICPDFLPADVSLLTQPEKPMCCWLPPPWG